MDSSINYENLFSNIYYNEGVFILQEIKLSQALFLRQVKMGAETFRRYKTQKRELPFYLVYHLMERTGDPKVFQYLRNKYKSL